MRSASSSERLRLGALGRPRGWARKGARGSCGGAGGRACWGGLGGSRLGSSFFVTSTLACSCLGAGRGLGGGTTWGGFFSGSGFFTSSLGAGGAASTRGTGGAGGEGGAGGSEATCSWGRPWRAGTFSSRSSRSWGLGPGFSWPLRGRLASARRRLSGFSGSSSAGLGSSTETTRKTGGRLAATRTGQSISRLTTPNARRWSRREISRGRATPGERLVIESRLGGRGRKPRPTPVF